MARNDGTDFNFGWNDAENNSAPWGRGTEADRGTDRGKRPDCTANSESASVSDPEFRQTGHAWDCTCGPCYLAEITSAQVTKMAHNITATVRKANRTDMAIPKPTASAKSNGRAPAPQRADGSGDFAPWLKVNELIKSRTLKIGQKFKMQIVEAREAGANNFSDVIVDVKIGGKLYAWGLKADKQVYATLYEKFGDRLDRWKGTVNALCAEPFKKGYNPSIQVL